MTTLTSPHDLLAAIPFLIGYHPSNSLVLVAIKEGTVSMAMRVDYPSQQNSDAYDLLAHHIKLDGAESALMIAYVPTETGEGGATGDGVDDLSVFQLRKEVRKLRMDNRELGQENRELGQENRELRQRLNDPPSSGGPGEDALLIEQLDTQVAGSVLVLPN